MTHDNHVPLGFFVDGFKVRICPAIIGGATGYMVISMERVTDNPDGGEPSWFSVESHLHCLAMKHNIGRKGNNRIDR